MTNDKNVLAAERYAQSLIDLCKNNDCSYGDMSNNLNNVSDILKQSEELVKTLNNPTLSLVQKKDIIETVFAKDVSSIVRNFLKLLVEKNRFSLFNDIVKVYNKLLDEVNEVARIEIISAVNLNEEEKNVIENKLNVKIKKQLAIKYNVDNTIIAGLIIKYGDDVIDMSLSQKLKNLKQEITK